MSSFMARRVPAALLPLVCVLSSVRSVGAQASREVTVALVDHLSDSAVATIVRFPGADGRTVILLRERDVDETALAAGMLAASEARRALGDTVRSKIIMQVYGRRSLTSMASNERELVTRYVTQLRGARPASLDGVGVARSVQVAMAPYRAGAKLR
jgi:hypothetical protein